MQKEIKYKGLSTVPSDYECEDGSLAVSFNLVQEDGVLKPVQPPKEKFTLLEGDKLMCIHKSNSFVNVVHYIIKNSSNTLYWRTDVDDTHHPVGNLNGADIYKVEAVGNTLVALTSASLHYYIWRDGAYVDLGTKIPEIPLQFGLKGEVYQSDRVAMLFPERVGEGAWEQNLKLSDNNISQVTQYVWGLVNKTINEQATKKGRFLFPFFVRYALRLYDGSLIYHSAPVLMPCSMKTPMYITADTSDGGNYHDESKDCYNGAALRAYAFPMKLMYKVLDANAITEYLSTWKDLVSSVDIFISVPLYTIDINEKIEKKEYAIGPQQNAQNLGYVVAASADGVYKKRRLIDEFWAAYGHDGGTGILPRPQIERHGYFKLPPKNVAEDIKDCAQFYFLKSIGIDKLSTSISEVEVAEDYLQSLVNREVMTDDYLSHDTIIARSAFGYNGRINLSNLTKRCFDGFRLDTMLPLCTSSGTSYNLNVHTAIVEDGKDIDVYSSNSPINADALLPMFLFYPNINAKSMEIAGQRYQLTKHSMLNGAYYINIENDSQKIATANRTYTGTTLMLDIPNKVYTSEINNPFFFPLAGINTVGTGDIIGISTAAKALSQGQFGQFPLYAFSTEGVWALEVSSAGTYKAKQPVTRDVCINAESITQIDTAVLFATDRGIMLIKGSETICLTDVLSGDDILNVAALPHLNEIAELADLTTDDFTLEPFHEYLKSCRLIYDYKNQRIIMYKPRCGYAYIYSLKSKQWGMMQSAIVDRTNSYPDALAVLSDNKVVNYSEEADRDYKGFLVTRPLKFDAPDVEKTVSTIVQRGYFRRGHIKCVLYGSRDMFNWFVVWTSQDHYLQGFSGTPYKYFRLVVLSEMLDDECLGGCSVTYNQRMTNRLR